MAVLFVRLEGEFPAVGLLLGGELSEPAVEPPALLAAAGLGDRLAVLLRRQDVPGAGLHEVELGQKADEVLAAEVRSSGLGLRFDRLRDQFLGNLVGAEEKREVGVHGSRLRLGGTGRLHVDVVDVDAADGHRDGDGDDDDGDVDEKQYVLVAHG